MMMEIVGLRGVGYSAELGSAGHQGQVVESSLVRCRAWTGQSVSWHS